MIDVSNILFLFNISYHFAELCVSLLKYPCENGDQFTQFHHDHEVWQKKFKQCNNKSKTYRNVE